MTRLEQVLNWLAIVAIAVAITVALHLCSCGVAAAVAKSRPVVWTGLAASATVTPVDSPDKPWSPGDPIEWGVGIEAGLEVLGHPVTARFHVSQESVGGCVELRGIGAVCYKQVLDGDRPNPLDGLEIQIGETSKV